MKTSIFKLIFEHDLRLESLASNQDPRKEAQRPSTLEEFLKPVQTYSSFYFSASNLEKEEFGLNSIDEAPYILEHIFDALNLNSAIDGDSEYSPTELPNFKPSQTFVLIPKSRTLGQKYSPELFSSDAHIREKIHVMRQPLDDGNYVLFVEKAHNGYDLYLFSKENIYEKFFERFQPMVSSTFRFFSINGKRAKSERLFYFETWSLSRPPHGFEEVFPQTRLR